VIDRYVHCLCTKLQQAATAVNLASINDGGETINMQRPSVTGILFLEPVLTFLPPTQCMTSQRRSFATRKHRLCWL
jgi:hypothetical protein